MMNAKFSAKSYTPHQCVTACYHCQQTGKQRCHCGDGYENYTEYFYDSNIKGQNSRQLRRTCRQCNGTTRSYSNCHICIGTAVVACSACGGSGKVNCRSCGATGWFTHVMVGWLEARPSKTFDYEKAMSPAAIAALKSMSSAERIGQCVTGSGRDQPQARGGACKYSRQIPRGASSIGYRSGGQAGVWLRWYGQSDPSDAYLPGRAA